MLEILRVVDNGHGFSISSGLHKPPAHTFGLDIPLEELKIKLLDDKVKVLLLCGHGGCGKTTLAKKKKLCEDSKIKGKWYFIFLLSCSDLFVHFACIQFYIDI